MAAMLALIGVAVGAIVALMSRFFGVASCGSPEALWRLAGDGDCANLVASMALRVGIATGVATVLLGLTVAGLARTAARIEEDRRVAAVERYGKPGVGRVPAMRAREADR